MKKSIVFLAVFMFLLSTKSNAVFNDVSEDAWYYDSVKYVYEYGILNGTGDGNFSPTAGMTRAMIAQVIYNMEDTPETENENTYVDIEAGKWYEKAVLWANENKIVSGVDTNKFAPDTEITKEQLITILYNYAKYKEYDVSVGEDTNILSYNDSFELSEYAYSPMQWACGAGIVTGYEGNLMPKKSLSRAEVATIIKNFKNYYPEINVAWVELEGNPTTGYIWSATNYDEEIIKVSDYQYISEDDEELVGQSGKFKFTIRALKEGQTTIIFKYARSWEGSSIRTILCDVKVDADKRVQLSQRSKENVKNFIVRTSLYKEGFTETDCRFIKSMQELEEYKTAFSFPEEIFDSIVTSFSEYNDEYFSNNWLAVVTEQESGVDYEIVSIDKSIENALTIAINKKKSDKVEPYMWHIFVELPIKDYSEINKINVLD